MTQVIRYIKPKCPLRQQLLNTSLTLGMSSISQYLPYVIRIIIGLQRISVKMLLNIQAHGRVILTRGDCNLQ